MQATQARPIVQTFPNPLEGKQTIISHTMPDHECFCKECPVLETVTLEVAYIPDKLCLEIHSLKEYWISFQSQGLWYENVLSQAYDEIYNCCSPKWLRITGEFITENGITSKIKVEKTPCPDYSHPIM